MGLFKRKLGAPGLCRLDNCNNSERSSRKFIKTNEAPYQTTGIRTLSATLGCKELNCSHFWLSLLSECLSCYLYVFIVCATRISWTGAIIGHEPNLLAMSLASGMAMMLLMFTFRTVHVNPALTISFLLTGRIPIIRALLYILVHCMGAIAAIAFLHSISIKGHAGALGLDNPHEVLSDWQILIVEVVISFVVTLATYATCNYSSYTSAKKLILEQLGHSPSLLSSSACDSTSTYRHSRRSIAPMVPQAPSTSINIMDEYRSPDGEHNANGNHCQNDQAQGFRPYLVSNHYNQVYDDYSDVMLNASRYPDKGQDFSRRGFQNQTTRTTAPNFPNRNRNAHHTISSHLTNDAHLGQHLMNGPKTDHKHSLLIDSSNTDDSNDTKFLSQAIDNGYINCNNPGSNSSGGSNNISSALVKPLVTSPQQSFRVNPQVKGFVLNSYQDDNNYDYEYDNHRIYATQQLKSDSSSQVPIEEVMQDECQLLAPNGFSIHVTSSQAVVIGLAYTLTSLTGIPASGASLNPARSFGPAFIMNRWDHHWIYWLGPILGAVIAGLAYEFIFNPTRKSSLCYRPKLFRLSAHDMAKVGTKSRLYQQQQQKPPTCAPHPSNPLFQHQTSHQHPTIQHSPSARAASTNLISNTNLLKSSRDAQIITTSASTAHLRPPYPISSTFDQLNHIHQAHSQSQYEHQQQKAQVHHQAPNFDRSKSTAMINSIANSKPHLSTMNLPQRNNAEFGKSFGASNRLDPALPGTELSFSEL